MQYKQIKVESLMKKILQKDTLFNGDYTIDPYQNCEFDCSYCDSSFDSTVYIKTNAVDIFKKEIDKIPKSVIIVGSVNDPYQNIEKTFEITRNLLKIIKRKNFICHILTKSDLILRDIDILSEIKDCNVTLSIVSSKNEVAKFFEKNVISADERFNLIKKLSDSGIKTGLALLPILPYLVEEEFENIVKSAKKRDAKYIITKALELKGDQKILFFDLLKRYRIDLVDKYEKLYKDSFKPDDKYILKTNENLDDLCRIYGIQHRHN